MSNVANVRIVLSNGTEAGKTINELTAQSSKLAREIKKMEVGSDEYVKATADYKKVSERLSEVRKEAFSTAKAQGFLNSEMGQFIPFNKQIGGMVGTFQGLSGAIKTATISQKALNIAIAASGIGALVIILVKLVQAFLDTQAGMDKVTAVTRPLMAIFDRLKGLAQELGGSVFKGLAQILKGDIAEGLKTLGQGVKDAVMGFGDAVKEGAKAGSEIDKLQKQIEKAQNEMILKQSRLNRGIAEQSERARDASLSEKERAEAAQKAIDLIAERTQAEDALLALQIKKLEIEQSLNDTDRSGEAEMNRLIAQREDLLANAARERVRLNSVINRTEKAAEKEITANLKEEAKERLKAIEEEQKARDKFIQDSISAEIKANEDRKKLDQDLLTGFKAQQQQEFDTRMQSLVTMAEAEQMMIDQLFLQGQIKEEERNQMMYDAQKKALEDRLALLMANGQQSSAAYQELFMELLRMNHEHEESKTKITEENEKKRKDLMQQGFSAAAGIFAGLATLLSQNAKARKKNFAVLKAVQAAEVAANTVTEISNIFKGYSALGPFGQALAIIQAAVAAARGASAISRINSTQIESAGGESFADGGPVFGKSHRDGGIPFLAGGQRHEMEGGEIILSKGVYQDPALRSAASVINQLGGGRSFALGGPVSAPVRSGFTSTSTSPAASTGSSALLDTRNMEALMQENVQLLRVIAEKPVLALTDIKDGLETLYDVENDATF
jgi:uncharacterized cupredoxin-like copper-binding protein